MRALRPAVRILFVDKIDQSGATAPKIKRLTSGDSPYSVAADDHILLCDTSSGAIQVDLPAISAGARELKVKVDAGSNDVTVDGNAAETIDGSATKVLDDAGRQAATLVTDGTGTNWSML